MPFDPSNTASPVFRFHSNEITTFVCRLDSGTAVPCDPDPSDPTSQMKGSKSYSGLSEGTHMFRVTVTDAAGNQRSVSFEWDIDLTVPDAIIDSSPLYLSNSNVGHFTFHTNEASTFTCSLEKDGIVVDSSACVPDPVDPTLKGSKSYGGLGDGTYIFTLTVTDEAHNTKIDTFE